MQLNAAQIGFDVIHPQLSLTISDAAQLSAFASGAGLRFSIPLADLPSGMFDAQSSSIHITSIASRLLGMARERCRPLRQSSPLSS